jgi:hypothetical protein
MKATLTEEEFAQLVKDCLSGGVPRHVLAGEFEVSEGTIGRWENGRSIPLMTIRGIVEARIASLGVNSRNVLNGYTTLHKAAIEGHLAVVKFLVASGADIGDCKNTVNETPLQVAATAGNTKVVDFLGGLDLNEAH